MYSTESDLGITDTNPVIREVEGTARTIIFNLNKKTGIL
jgi:hypothetical protein